MTLVALRHLPTAWNRSGQLQGRADVPIELPSAEMRNIIKKNLIELNNLGPFNAICCSTLQRTAQTAAAYGFYSVKREALLDEFDFGIYEGKPCEQMLTEIGDQWVTSPHTLALGETMANLEKRIRRFLLNYRDQNRVLIFGHGCWLRGLLSIQQSGSIKKTNQINVPENTILQFSSVEKLA